MCFIFGSLMQYCTIELPSLDTSERDWYGDVCSRGQTANVYDNQNFKSLSNNGWSFGKVLAASFMSYTVFRFQEEIQLHGYDPEEGFAC